MQKRKPQKMNKYNRRKTGHFVKGENKENCLLKKNNQKKTYRKFIFSPKNNIKICVKREPDFGVF